MSFTNRRGLPALTLSLAMLAGCAAPAPTGAPATTAAAPTAEAPAAQPAPAAAGPAVAAPAVVASQTFTGVVSFHGTPVAGYAMKAYDARTGAALDGAAVTDAKGAFSLTVPHVAAGTAVKLVATQGKAAITSIVTAGAASATYSVFADADVTVDENSTAIAIALQGVLTSTLLLSDEAARPIVEKQMAAIKALSAKLSEAFKANPALANQLVNPDSGNAETSAASLFESAGLVKDLTELVASALTDVASAAQDPAKQGKKDDDRAKTLETVKLLGSALDAKIDLKDNKVTLVNRFNGKTADATDASSVSTASQQTRPSGSSNGNGGGNLLPYAIDKSTLVNLKPSVQYHVPIKGGEIEVVMIGRIGTDGPFVWSFRKVWYDGYRVLMSDSNVVQVTNAARYSKDDGKIVAVPATDALLVDDRTYVYTSTSTIRVTLDVNDPSGDGSVACDGTVAPKGVEDPFSVYKYASFYLPFDKSVKYHVLAPAETEPTKTVPTTHPFVAFESDPVDVLPGLGFTRPTAGAITSGALTFTPVAWGDFMGPGVIWRIHAKSAGQWSFTYNQPTTQLKPFNPFAYHVNDVQLQIGTPGPSGTSPADDRFLLLPNDASWRFQTIEADAVTSNVIETSGLPKVASPGLINNYPQVESIF